LTTVVSIPVDGVGGWDFEASELGADLFGVRVIEVVQDGQGLLPGIAGGLGLPVAW
jgi:hypothetical protein